jgi:aspartate carbamoyltransferase catalytic subunit
MQQEKIQESSTLPNTYVKRWDFTMILRLLKERKKRAALRHSQRKHARVHKKENKKALLEGEEEEEEDDWPDVCGEPPK